MLIPIYASLLAAPVPQCSTDFCSKTAAYEQLCSAAVKDIEYFAMGRWRALRLATTDGGA